MKKTKKLLFALTIAMFSLIPLFKLEAAADTQRDVYPVTEYNTLKNINNLDSTWTKQYVFTLQDDLSGSKTIVFSDSDQSKIYTSTLTGIS